MIKSLALPSFTIMLAAERYTNLIADVTLAKNELLEIHRSKISLHHAKTGYDYPTIRLPHTFSRLAGLSTRIYQTIYDGSLAFLTVLSPTENASKHPKPPSSHGGGRNTPANDLNKLFSKKAARRFF
jgi:hypothetical protein